MIKRFCLFLLLVVQSLFSFHDEELEKLWSSITDINHPTVEEYQAIEQYLREGERPYLAPFGDHDRVQRIRGLQLIGPNNELPLFEQHSLNVTQETEGRCILIYASYNGIYPDKARNLLTELGTCGYSGHVLIRIGGFPDLEQGGLKLCHVPYAFKVAFLKEAQRLGYKEVLWLDTALHPLTDLELIFKTIKEKGYFFTNVGLLSDNRSTHLSSAAQELGIAAEQYHSIPHISSSIIGLNLLNGRAVRLLKSWHEAAEKVYPFITCWPEELSLSIIAWRLQCKPYGWFGNNVCAAHELNMPDVRQRPLQFYIDPIRRKDEG